MGSALIKGFNLYDWNVISCLRSFPMNLKWKIMFNSRIYWIESQLNIPYEWFPFKINTVFQNMYVWIQCTKYSNNNNIFHILLRICDSKWKIESKYKWNILLQLNSLWTETLSLIDALVSLKIYSNPWQKYRWKCFVEILFLYLFSILTWY